MAQETQTGALYHLGWGVRGEGGSKGRRYMYTYGWFMLGFDRKQQNSVKQLSFDLKKIKKKQKWRTWREREKKKKGQSWPRKSTLTIHWKVWCWSWGPNTLSTWWEEPTHWKRPWCWERLKVEGEGSERGWDGWHLRLNGHEFEQTLGDSEGQGSLACCHPWGRKESDTAERLNNNNKVITSLWAWNVTAVSNWPSVLLGASEDLYRICFRIVHLRDKRREHFYHQWTLTLHTLKE